MSEMETVGIFGGSFNPVHIGHMMLASYLSQWTEIEHVWFNLSPQNPLKNPDGLLDDAVRLEMLNRATAEVPDVAVCDIELSMPRPSYTINTLDALSGLHSSYRFKLIIGADNWVNFSRWKDYQRIIDEYGVIVYPRPGHFIDPATLPAGVTLVDAPVIELSSTFIRNGIASGKDMRAFLPAGVYDYIMEHGLYRADNAK